MSMYATKPCFIKDLGGYRLLLKHTDCTTLPSAKADMALRPQGSSENEDGRVPRSALVSHLPDDLQIATTEK